MLRLELLSTEHCSLCEQALDMLLGMPEIAGLQLVVVDIADDQQLLSTYGEQIPVLRTAGQELKAPFTAKDVVHFLERLAAQFRTSDGRSSA